VYPVADIDRVLAAVIVPEVNAAPVLSGHEKDSMDAGYDPERVVTSVQVFDTSLWNLFPATRQRISPVSFFMIPIP
jgi:hypothetical protein